MEREVTDSMTAPVEELPADRPPLTVSDFIVMLIEGVKAGDWKDSDTFMVSADPEGNRYVAFDREIGFGRTRLEKAPRFGYRAAHSEDLNAIVIFPMHEIDPED